MGRNPRALYKADRIDPHPRKASERPQKRKHAREAAVEEAPLVEHDEEEVPEDVEEQVSEAEQEFQDEDAGEQNMDDNEDDDNDADDDVEGFDAPEVFTTAKSVHDLEKPAARVGSVSRSAKVRVQLVSEILMHN